MVNLYDGVAAEAEPHQAQAAAKTSSTSQARRAVSVYIFCTSLPKTVCTLLCKLLVCLCCPKSGWPCPLPELASFTRCSLENRSATQLCGSSVHLWLA